MGGNLVLWQSLCGREAKEVKDAGWRRKQFLAEKEEGVLREVC